MLNKFILILIAGMCISCGSTNEGKASGDTVTNPVTANDPSAKSEDNAPVISFDENIHDFGKLTEGEIVTYKFKFKNTGNADLIISNASASCGCTVPSYPRNPVAPGDESSIDVQFNSGGKVGINEKTVTIESNTVPTQTYLLIKADVLVKK